MNSNSTESPFILSKKEIVGVYLLLKKRENRLDRTLHRLFARIEKKLYEQLTIEEFEQLNRFYHKKIDFDLSGS